MGGLKNWGYGGLGGAAFSLISPMIPGGPLIAGALGAALVGSVVKGVPGEVIATMLGFQAGLSFLQGGGIAGLGASQQSNNAPVVM
jgi:hypothetical protein